MEVPHKGGNGIVNYNPRCTYCPLVPKRDTFYVTDGSPQVRIQEKAYMDFIWVWILLCFIYSWMQNKKLRIYVVLLLNWFQDITR